MPDFYPNEYLFENHKKGENWETYAWAVRDAMLKCGNFETTEATLKEKRTYDNYMNIKKGAEKPKIN